MCDTHTLQIHMVHAHHAHSTTLQQQQQQQQQGFVQFRLSGENLHLDVDTLNEKLKLNGAARMRAAMKPDEAFGMIFNWYVVVLVVDNI